MKVLRIAMVLVFVAALYVFRLALLALGCIVYVYLLPAVIASNRDYPRAGRIYWVCGLTGWLLIPWLACLLFVLLHTKPQSAEHMLFHWS